MGARIFQVRLALGDGHRKPMSMRAFAAMLSAATGREPPYNASFISRWENGESEPRLDELALIASVDPLRRGAPWLAWNIPTVGEVGRNGDKVDLYDDPPAPPKLAPTPLPAPPGATIVTPSGVVIPPDAERDDAAVYEARLIRMNAKAAAKHPAAKGAAKKRRRA